jgi:Tfp pilus assembly protein PilF
MATATQHFQAGRFEEASVICRQTLEHDLNNHSAVHMLGMISAQAGRTDLAIEQFQRAIELQPAIAQYHCNLGTVLASAEKPQAAANAFRYALQLQPNYFKALSNLGHLWMQMGQPTPAIDAFQQAVALCPNDPVILNDLGNALRAGGAREQAITVYHQATAAAADFADSYSNLAVALLEKNDFLRAEEACRRSIALRPDFPEAFVNLSNVLLAGGRLVEAEGALRQAISISPDLAIAHHNLGINLLTQGNFTQGWSEYAWRSRVRGSNPICREFPRPLWDGGKLHGRTILLHAEQGFGDTIQFIRYLPMVRATGGRIILDCPRELLALLKGSFDVDQWIETGQKLPAFDLHCPLLSLPGIFGTTLANIPTQAPYLFPPIGAVQHWKSRVAGEMKFKIGIAWAGSATHVKDGNRSLPISTLAPLGQIAGTALYSLQKGQAARVSRGMGHLTDWTDELWDFAETAALISNLDLVISVDTAVAHLAGAMGKPAWVLLPFSPDWRWMMHREDSPWYPTMRLFRQSQPGDWSQPIAKVFDALRAILQSRMIP